MKNQLFSVSSLTNPAPFKELPLTKKKQLQTTREVDGEVMPNGASVDTNP
jgi:hypothetical protein